MKISLPRRYINCYILWQPLSLLLLLDNFLIGQDPITRSTSLLISRQTRFQISSAAPPSSNYLLFRSPSAHEICSHEKEKGEGNVIAAQNARRGRDGRWRSRSAEERRGWALEEALWVPGALCQVQDACVSRSTSLLFPPLDPVPR